MTILLDRKERKCSKCGYKGQEKEFRKNRNICLPCQRKYENDYNSKNKGSVNARNRKYRKSRIPEIVKRQREQHTKYMRDSYRERSMVISARKRAKKRGIEFNICAEDILIPEFCPLLGISINSNGHINNRDSSPSLDRKNTEKGYIKSNIGIISYRANRIKNDATPKELKLLAERIDDYISGKN